MLYTKHIIQMKSALILLKEPLNTLSCKIIQVYITQWHFFKLERAKIASMGNGSKKYLVEYNIIVIIVEKNISIFVYKVNIWSVNCARATAFIFDSRMDVLVELSFWDRKCPDPRRGSNRQPSD